MFRNETLQGKNLGPMLDAPVALRHNRLSFHFETCIVLRLGNVNSLLPDQGRLPPIFLSSWYINKIGWHEMPTFFIFVWSEREDSPTSSGALRAPLRSADVAVPGRFSDIQSALAPLRIHLFNGLKTKRVGTKCQPFSFLYGRSERIRTSDPLDPNQVRYQAALRSDGGNRYHAAHKRSILF